MWRCPQCGESLEDQFDNCWRCGSANPRPEPSAPPVRHAASSRDLTDSPPAHYPDAPKFRLDAPSDYNRAVSFARFVLAYRLQRGRRSRPSEPQFPDRDRLWNLAKAGLGILVLSMALLILGAYLPIPQWALKAVPWGLGAGLIVSGLALHRATWLELGPPY